MSAAISVVSGYGLMVFFLGIWDFKGKAERWSRGPQKSEGKRAADYFSVLLHRMKL